MLLHNTASGGAGQRPGHAWTSARARAPRSPARLAPPRPRCSRSRSGSTSLGWTRALQRRRKCHRVLAGAARDLGTARVAGRHALEHGGIARTVALCRRGKAARVRGDQSDPRTVQGRVLAPPRCCRERPPDAFHQRHRLGTSSSLLGLRSAVNSSMPTCRCPLARARAVRPASPSGSPPHTLTDHGNPVPSSMSRYAAVLGGFGEGRTCSRGASRRGRRPTEVELDHRTARQAGPRGDRRARSGGIPARRSPARREPQARAQLEAVSDVGVGVRVTTPCGDPRRRAPRFVEPGSTPRSAAEPRAGSARCETASRLPRCPSTASDTTGVGTPGQNRPPRREIVLPASSPRSWMSRCARESASTPSSRTRNVSSMSRRACAARWGSSPARSRR